MKRKLSLSAKFNLVFAIGLSAVGVVADRLLQKQALDETVHDANVLISAAASMQSYTATHVTPLLATQIKYQVLCPHNLKICLPLCRAHQIQSQSIGKVKAFYL